MIRALPAVLIALPSLLAVDPATVVSEAFGGRTGALIILDTPTGRIIDAAPTQSATPRPPCSTFKIWNALLGIERGLITSADQPFHEWDGTPHPIADWNRDLTFHEAFQASCVPAFQDLARRIGPDAMNAWLRAIHYGDRNTSSGLDVFWLPAEGRQPVLITPSEQAELIRKLLAGEIPASPKSRALLREVMLARTSVHGTLYGKTGTGRLSPDANVGWYVGWVESNGSTRPFACVLVEKGVMGKDARALVENTLEKLGWL